jgi:rubredoxin
MTFTKCKSSEIQSVDSLELILKKYVSFSQAFSLRLRQSRQEGRRGHAVKTQAAFGAKAKTSDKVYLCIDCGYIYDGRVPFSELEKDYICPVCQAPKRRYDTTDLCTLRATF